MQKFIAIILSTVVLFQSSQIKFDDVNNLPNLIEHLNCHINHGHSLVEFMSLHYGTNSEKHTTNNEHKNLPFKHKHNQAQFHIDYIIFKNVFLIPTQNKITTLNLFNYKSIAKQLVIHNFFQPPKFK
ncbi:MAG TPA: hypothetical protein VJ970_05690 [Flavobacteriaceae bacterium]|nr:hypothetical protein [Flavobacteriaceae bacterium]